MPSLYLFLLLLMFLVAPCGTQAYAATPPETLPLVSIHDLLDSAHTPDQKVLIRGAVTYNGRELIVQDQTGAVAVHSTASAAPSLGDEVEIEGTLRKSQGIPLIENATIRQLWAGSTPLPLAITPDEAAEGAYNGMLVVIEGKLMKSVVQANGGFRLTLDGGDQTFTCASDAGDSTPLASFDPGATLRCTGVLSLEQPHDALGNSSFAVLLGSANDLRQIVPAPWWTPRHLMFVFLALLPIGMLAYRMHLRNVRRRMEDIVEERSRIAREIHDTLAQGYAGIALQLQAVSRTMEVQSEITEAHLSMALQMVRRSRAEAHRSIATLRTLHSSDELATMIAKLARQLTEPARIKLSVERQGAVYSLPDEVSSQVLRICQEAIANVVEHSGASTVNILLTYAPNHLCVEIRDNGEGFDPDRTGSTESGHFGITGMRERAAQIRACLHLQSTSEGTVVTLQVPMKRTSGLGALWPGRFRQQKDTPMQASRQEIRI